MEETVVFVVFGGLALLFCVKLAWNIAMPVALARQRHRGEQPASDGVSIAAVVEWGLLASGVIVVFIDGVFADVLPSPLWVALVGTALATGSYAVMFLLWLVLLRNR